MKYMKSTPEILSQVYNERRSSPSTQQSYTRAVRFFEKHTGKTIGELLTIADHEETNNIHWKNSTLKPILISYRSGYMTNTKKNSKPKFCRNHYNISTF